MNYYYFIIAALILNMFIFDKIPLLRYILIPIAGLTLSVSSFFLAPIAMTLAVWFIKWDNEPSLGSYPTDLEIKHNFIIRGDSPKWCSWLQPPDERWPGPMYEPAFEELYLKRGKVFAAWQNGALRNQLMGLAAAMGKPTTDYIPETNGFWQRDDIWRLSVPIGPIRIVTGWQVYKKQDETFLAVPVCTLKRN